MRAVAPFSDDTMVLFWYGRRRSISVFFVKWRAGFSAIENPLGDGCGLRKCGVSIVFRFSVVFEEVTGGECDVVVIVVASSGGAGREGKVLMAGKVFEGDLMAVSAVVRGEADSHVSCNFLVVFLVAADALGGIEVFEEDGVLWVLELACGVGVAKGFKVFSMAVIAGLITDSCTGEKTRSFFIVVAGDALHLYLIVAMGGVSRKKCCFVVCSEHQV